MSTVLPDLQVAWLDACAEFTRATGIDLATAVDDTSSDAYNIADRFRDRLNAANAKDAESRHKINKAKTAVGNTIVAVERIGNVASQGVSMVFGSPATITMSCISFLVDAGFEYKNIAHNVDDLFSRIAAIMERSQVYREHERIMEPAMVWVAHRILMAVVSICGLCIKVLNSNKVKRFLGIALFSHDGGIKDQLDILQSIEAQELQMKGTLTLIATETNKRNIVSGFEEIKATEAEIVRSVSELNANSTDQQALIELRQKLGVEDQNFKEEYWAYQDKLRSGTCSWLKDDSQYQDWSSTGDKEGSLLILKGDEGSGKSYTLSAIIWDLMMRYPQGRQDARRTSIAYYYLTRAGKKDAQSLKLGPSIRDALRTWAWQIINNDLFYRKDIEAIFKQTSDLGDFNECWHKLFLKRLDKNVTFFLLLDGAHELEDKGVAELTTLLKTLPMINAHSCRIKIAMTSRPVLVRNLTSQVPMNISIVNLQDKSHTDIRNYINEKAETLAIFQKRTPEVQGLKARVCSGLFEAIDGNFLLADIKLREIGSKNEPEEILEIIERTKKQGASLNDSIVEDIRECNRTLNTREIQNLNTMLLWIIYTRWDLQVNELESILFIQQGKSSLQPLANEIRDKFSAFLKMDNNEDEQNAYVTLKHDSIADYFTDISARNQSLDTPDIQPISKGEIRMVQHFIRKLCEQEMYDKLGLEEFFDQKLSHSDTNISVDGENAHLKIALGCLRILTGEFSEEAEGLKTYAMYEVDHHLKQIDLDSTLPQLKAELGPRLVKLFTDRAAILRAEVNSRNASSYNDNRLREALHLFHSSAVMKKVRASDKKSREWVDAILNHVTPEIALLQDTAKIKAELWLTTEYSPKVVDHFQWLYGYYNKVGNVDLVLPFKLIKAGVARYGILELFIARADTFPNLWVEFHRVLSIDADYLPARASLARAYAEEVKDGPKPDWEKALYHQDISIQGVMSGMRLFTDTDLAGQLSDLLRVKATWLRKLDRFDEACAIYQNLLNEVVETLQGIQQEIDQKTQKSHLTRFFHMNYNNPTYHSAIHRAFTQVGHMLEIRTSKDINKQDSRMVNMYCRLIYYFAVLIYNYGDSATEREEAIQLWERIITIAKADGRVYGSQVSSARRLAKIYIGKAVEGGRDSDVAAEMLTNLHSLTVTVNGVNDQRTDEQYRDIGISRAQVRSLLGRYYSGIGEVAKAKEQLRPDIEVGIKLLSDEDPVNDYQGYRKLGDALMDFGDDANAIAAWCLIQPTEGFEELWISPTFPPDANGSINSEGSNIAQSASESPLPGMAKNADSTGETSPSQRLPLQPSSTFDLARKLIGPINYRCDGDCGKKWTYADDLYVCRECIDVQMDAPCLEKLRRGEIDGDVCDRNHRFMHVPAWNLAGFKRAQEGKVLVSGNILTVDAWLENIKQDWGLQI
ncbi:MAG: hypothetical protein M1820_006280 [Bogoriella megaspora]|nr:MAG: hypothetical protein M1820_006280 [Bogoriella megaspora]